MEKTNMLYFTELTQPILDRPPVHRMIAINPAHVVSVVPVELPHEDRECCTLALVTGDSMTVLGSVETLAVQMRQGL
jgi:hypothetical protein